MSDSSPTAVALQILHLEDDPADAELVRRALISAGIDARITCVDCREDFARGLAIGCDLILADYTLPRFDGLSALAIAAAQCPLVPFVFVSGSLGEEIAIETFKRGATDYVLKGHLQRLGPAVVRAIEAAAQQREALRAEQELRETQHQLQLAVEIAQLGGWEMDLQTGAFRYSEQWKKQLGYGADEIEDSREEWESRLHPDDRRRVLAAMASFLADPSTPFAAEFRLCRKDGCYRWFASRAVRRDEPGHGPRISGTHLDITDRKEAEERILHAAQHDPLTGLANRKLLYEFGEHLLSGARRARSCVGFLFFDLDRFKPVNDTYGHAVGDEVLKQVGVRLTACMRREDIIGRLGGDEFLAILGHLASPEDAARIACHAVDHLSRPYLVHGLEFQLSLSIGISVFPRDGDTVDALIRNADSAMYFAKENGRNNFQYFTEELDQRAVAVLAIENAMRGSFERGEFELHYQPLIDTQSGEVVSVEALMRWHPPGDAEIGPEQFIPVAEMNGFIQPLGDWALHEACRQHQEWRREGLPPIPVAVNVAALQFRREQIRHTVARVISETGISPEYVQIELTESTVMRNVDEAIAILDALKALGLKIALDDFGTGYSSLAYLRRLPVDKLKVDKSFVKNACIDENSQIITEAIIGLAHNLKLEVVAEGVDSEAALAFVTERQCDQVQGFLFSRALPGNEFAEWFRQREGFSWPRAKAAAH